MLLAMLNVEKGFPIQYTGCRGGENNYTEIIPPYELDVGPTDISAHPRLFNKEAALVAGFPWNSTYGYNGRFGARAPGVPLLGTAGAFSNGNVPIPYIPYLNPLAGVPSPAGIQPALQDIMFGTPFAAAWSAPFPNA